MRLSLKMLKNYTNINSFEITDVAHLREDQTNVVYVQLIDLDRNMRYLSPEAAPSMSILFPSINSEKIYTVTADMLNSDDKSLWSIALTPEQVVASGSIKVIFTEGFEISKFLVQSCISMELLSQGQC